MDNTFTKISVKLDVKREIDILAASEQRSTYEVVDDMLKIYKSVALGKKGVSLVSVSDVVANHEVNKSRVNRKIKEVAHS